MQRQQQTLRRDAGDMPAKGDWSEVRDACCVPPRTRAQIPPAGEQTAPVVLGRQGCQRQLANVLEASSPSRPPTRLVHSLHRRAVCIHSEPWNVNLSPFGRGSLSPRFASHERGATPTFVWQPPLLSCLADVWWRLPSGSRGRQPVHAFVINRAIDAACGRKTHAPSSPAPCYLILTAS